MFNKNTLSTCFAVVSDVLICAVTYVFVTGSRVVTVIRRAAVRNCKYKA